LLLSDFGFGRALYEHLDEGLARHLARQGFTVYVAELRGQGASSSGQSLRALVHLDLPAIAQAIAREHPGPLDLVAHGWLGTLALAATTHELAVRKVVALNTPVVFEAPPQRLAAALAADDRFSSFSGSLAGAEAFEVLFLNHSQIEARRLEELRAQVRPLSAATAREWLSWMRAGDLPLDDGTSVRSRLARFDRPTLLLLGLADSVAGPELCAPLRERSPKVTVRMFSRFDTGDDFGHVTSLVGVNAASLVYPEISTFLRSEVP
jgi:pimeloyl-ACP methyl ester carboxylesterase